MRSVVLITILAVTSGCSSAESAPATPGGDGSTGDGGNPRADGGKPPPLVWTVMSEPAFDVELLVSMWGTAATKELYVGTKSSRIYHRKPDSTWTQTTVGANEVRSIWGSAPSDVYAAEGTDIGSGGLFHSTGDDVWTPVTLPFTTPNLRSTWGSSANDVYVVGADGPIFHSKNNAPWTIEFQSMYTSLDSVWGSGPADVYALGRSGNTLLHSRGDGMWDFQDTHDGRLASMVWGSGPTDVYISLSPDNLLEGPAGVLHSAGAGNDWTAGLSLAQYRLPVLWGSGPNDVYLGGEHVNDQNIPDAPALYHSNGDGQWTPITVPGAIIVTCIFGTSAADVYLCGLDASVHGILLHGQPAGR